GRAHVEANQPPGGRTGKGLSFKPTCNRYPDGPGSRRRGPELALTARRCVEVDVLARARTQGFPADAGGATLGPEPARARRFPIVPSIASAVSAGILAQVRRIGKLGRAQRRMQRTTLARCRWSRSDHARYRP